MTSPNSPEDPAAGWQSGQPYPTFRIAHDIYQRYLNEAGRSPTESAYDSMIEETLARLPSQDESTRSPKSDPQNKSETTHEQLSNMAKVMKETEGNMSGSDDDDFFEDDSVADDGSASPNGRKRKSLGSHSETSKLRSKRQGAHSKSSNIIPKAQRQTFDPSLEDCEKLFRSGKLFHLQKEDPLVSYPNKSPTKL